MSFANKVVIVTGASSGIGAATAILFAKNSASVVLVGRNKVNLHEVANKCKNNNIAKTHIIVADMSNDDDVKRIVQDSIKTFGKIDVVVNNAGFGGIGVIEDVSVYDRIMATNMRGVYLLTGLAVPHLQKTKVEIVDSWFLMGSPGPAAIILTSYFLFVILIGPSYMEKRSPYQLKNVLILYNALQVVFSVFLFVKCFMHLWKHGIVHSECIMNDQETQKEVAGIVWWYFIAKVTELLDTVFFVLRKKNAQLSFLHIYHHSIMVGGTWVFLKYGVTDHAVFTGLLNSGVHVIMYSYYGLAAMGPGIQRYLWWKKYLTGIQLIQFLCIVIHLSVNSMVSECPLPRALFWYFVSSTFLFFYLFADFYIKEFVAKRKAVEKRSSEAVACNGVEALNTKVEKCKSQTRLRRNYS